MRDFERDAEAGRNTEMAKAILHRDLLKQGCILRFRAANGDLVLAGPLPKAVGPTTFGVRRFVGRSGRIQDTWGGGDVETTSPWGAALDVVRHVGRRKPFDVLCPSKVK